MFLSCDAYSIFVVYFAFSHSVCIELCLMRNCSAYVVYTWIKCMHSKIVCKTPQRTFVSICMWIELFIIFQFHSKRYLTRQFQKVHMTCTVIEPMDKINVGRKFYQALTILKMVAQYNKWATMSIARRHVLVSSMCTHVI